MDEWIDSLRRAEGALRPDAGALASVGTEVRRRRRRRSAVTAVAAAAAVAVVIGGIAFASQRRDPAGRVATDPTSDATPSTTSSPSDAPSTRRPRERGGCPELSKIFDPDAVPPPSNEDVARFKRQYAAIIARDFDGFELHTVEVLHIGVVALVTGDLAAAKSRLREHGVTLVGRWDPRGAADSGLDAMGQVEALVENRITSVGHPLAEQLHARTGFAEIAMWSSAGAVLVSWKAPVPDEIAALDGTKRRGVKILVEGVPYSEAELATARQRVTDAVGARRIDVTVWTASFCGDQSGLRIGVPRKAVRERKQELEREMSQVAGVPVTVVESGRPVNF